MNELDELADRLRQVTVRLRLERWALPGDAAILPWEMLQESERVNWRDFAIAAQKVMA